jgi:ABC-2 type transport system permease protein
MSRYSSIGSAAINEPISTPLPMITRFLPELSLRSATAAGMSPCSRVEFDQSSLVEGPLQATYSGELLSFAAFFLSEAILSSHHRGSLADPGALRAVLSAGIGLFAIAPVGVALGAIIRHTAGAVAALPALIYLPLVALSLPVPWNERIGKLTMLMASYQLVSLRSQASVFSPLVSLLVLLAWPAVGLVVAAFLINRDA